MDGYSQVSSSALFSQHDLTFQDLENESFP